jgi:hypothetical protein
MDCAIPTAGGDGLRAETFGRSPGFIHARFLHEQKPSILRRPLQTSRADDDEFVNVVWMPHEVLYQRL